MNDSHLKSVLRHFKVASIAGLVDGDEWCKKVKDAITQDAIEDREYCKQQMIKNRIDAMKETGKMPEGSLFKNG